MEQEPAIICGARSCGAVAHLGERFNGIEEAQGSSPCSSTNFLFEMNSGFVSSSVSPALAVVFTKVATSSS